MSLYVWTSTTTVNGSCNHSARTERQPVCGTLSLGSGSAAAAVQGAAEGRGNAKPCGLNIRARLEACGDNLTGLRDRALLSTAYDTGLRASELVAVEVEHIIETIDPDARLLTIKRSKGDPEGEGATAICARARFALSQPAEMQRVGGFGMRW